MSTDDLTAAHDLILEAMRTGSFADFARDDDPKELPPYDDDDFWRGRTVDGDWLSTVLRMPSEPLRGLSMGGARILAALKLNGADIPESVFLSQCQLGRSPISLVETRLRSLVLDGVRCGGITGDSFEASRRVLLDQCVFEGPARLLDATIGDVLACRGSRFAHPGDIALSLDRARIGGSLVFTNSEVDGDLNMVGTSIAGNAEFSGAHLRSERTALSLDRAKIGGRVWFHNGFHAQGFVSLAGADVGGSVHCSGGHFENPTRMALFLDNARIGRRLHVNDGFRADGLVSLMHTRVAGLEDDRDSWPERMAMDGFEYERLYGTDRSWKSRKEWLRRQVNPSPQPYIELAKVYRATGHERPARKILIERHNVLINPPDHWKPQLPGGVKGAALKAWRTFLRITIGHGYEPWRILALAAPLVVWMSLQYAWAKHDSLMRPTGTTTATAADCTPAYPCLQPVVYALDTLLPIIDFGQTDKWVPDQSRPRGRALAVWTWFTIGAGWAFATLVAASFTQAVRRE